MTDMPRPTVLDEEDLGGLAHEALEEALNSMNRISDLEILAYQGETVHIGGTVAPLSGEGLLARIDRERQVLNHDLLGSVALSLREISSTMDGHTRTLNDIRLSLGRLAEAWGVKPAAEPPEAPRP